MNFSQDTDQSVTSIHAYTDEFIAINEFKYNCHCQLHKSGFVEEWAPVDISKLTIDDFKSLLDCKPDVILLGTGQKLSFPNTELRREFDRLNIGLEVMDTGAACRTYNVLLSEDRNVAAAILLLSTQL